MTDGESLGRAVRAGRLAGPTRHQESRLRAERRAGPLADGLKRCARCLVPQPTAAFARRRDARDGLQAWCRTCAAADQAARRESATEAQVEARRARWRRWRAARRDEQRPKERERSRAYQATVVGRLVQARTTARRRLRRATDPRSVARLSATVARLDAEIARLRAARDAVGPDDRRRDS